MEEIHGKKIDELKSQRKLQVTKRKCGNNNKNCCIYNKKSSFQKTVQRKGNTARNLEVEFLCKLQN